MNRSTASRLTILYLSADSTLLKNDEWEKAGFRPKLDDLRTSRSNIQGTNVTIVKDAYRLQLFKCVNLS